MNAILTIALYERASLQCTMRWRPCARVIIAMENLSNECLLDCLVMAIALCLYGVISNHLVWGVQVAAGSAHAIFVAASGDATQDVYESTRVEYGRVHGWSMGAAVLRLRLL